MGTGGKGRMEAGWERRRRNGGAGKGGGEAEGRRGWLREADGGGPRSGVRRMEDNTVNGHRSKYCEKGAACSKQHGQKCKQLGYELADTRRSNAGNCPCSPKQRFFPSHTFSPQTNSGTSLPPPPSQLSPLARSLPPPLFSQPLRDGGRTMLVLSCRQCECSACPPRVPAAAAEPRALQQRCPPGRLPEHTTALHRSERKKKDEINGEE